MFRQFVLCKATKDTNSTLMSSDQQLNVHISIVNDLCQTNDSQRDCDNTFECYTNSSTENTVDDIITANIVLENETLTNCGSKHSEYTKNNGDGDTENLETYEYDTRSLAVGETINFQSGEPTMALSEKIQDGLERIKHSESIIQSGKNIECEDNDVIYRDRGQDDVDILNNDFTANHIPLPIIGDESSLVSSNLVDQQIQCDVPAQLSSLITAQSNEKSSENSNRNQPETRSDNDEIQEADKKDSNLKQKETKNEPRTLAEKLLNISSETTAKSSTNEPKELAEEQPNNSSETTNQIVESSTEDPSVDGDKTENYTEGSNDDEILSNESDSNEQSNEFPDIVDFDGINEVENDEYILDTFVRKPRKERRRIVSINDDSDPEVDVERERLLQSPLIEENKLSVNENEEEDVDLEMLIQNEKPGPKSKKMSTQKLKELQTRALLRNAVVIPSSCGKKKKSRIRIIDSDDEGENSLLPYCVDVDDIGIPDMTEDNDNEGDVLAASCILLNDIDKAETYPIENSRLDETAAQSSICAMSPYTNQSKEIELTEHEDMSTGSTIPKDINSQIEDYESCQDLQKQSIKISQGSVKHKSADAIISGNETVMMCDSGNSTDSSNQQCRKEDDVDNVVKHIPPFPSSSSSEDDDEFIPNDVYFGTPDVRNKRR